MKIGLHTMACAALVVAISASGSANAQELKGKVRIDGSSTVFPITEAVAEEFQGGHRRVRVTVGVSGTGGGFKKFAVGEIDISDASRPIKAKEEKLCAENGIEYIELPVAFDGLSVLVNPKNDWCTDLTVAELKALWSENSTIKLWSDVRPEWPNKPIKFFGPDHDSGTFDYFAEVILGKGKTTRHDYMASADDNVLVRGVSGEKYAIGFFGYAYYAENTDLLKLVAIDGGKGPITPTTKTINDGSYAPLARPIFIYVASSAAKRPEIKKFVQFYMEHAPELVAEVGYVPLPSKAYTMGLKRFNQGITGSLFNKPTEGFDLIEVMEGKAKAKWANAAGSK